ncbi:MAG: NUDIX domain-containing protein [Bacteroidetes bacterium]|nr:NUDIX domain-containing protein [Bacteroidota bacterium]
MKSHLYENSSNIRISTAGVACKGEYYFVAKRKPGTSIGESWEFPGGKNRKSETPEETLKREFFEEFQAEITVHKTLFVGEFMNKDQKYQLMAFSITINTPEEEMLFEEHQEIDWKTINELESSNMADSDRQIVSSLKKNLK